MAPGGSFHLSLDGVPITKSVTVPGTDGWQTWQTIEIPNVPFTAGTARAAARPGRRRLLEHSRQLQLDLGRVDLAAAYPAAGPARAGPAPRRVFLQNATLTPIETGHTYFADRVRVSSERPVAGSQP